MSDAIDLDALARELRGELMEPLWGGRMKDWPTQCRKCGSHEISGPSWNGYWLVFRCMRCGAKMERPPLDAPGGEK